MVREGKVVDRRKSSRLSGARCANAALSAEALLASVGTIQVNYVNRSVTEYIVDN